MSNHRYKHHCNYESNVNKLSNISFIIHYFIQINFGLESNYDITNKLIGEGSYGKVFKAYDKKTKNLCAVKIITKKKKKKEDLKKILQEIEILKSLNHPNIIKFLNHYETKKAHFVFTEYCKESLLNVISL